MRSRGIRKRSWNIHVTDQWKKYGAMHWIYLVTWCPLINRDFCYDVYTILNRIKLTKWTICAFRAMNPRQWSLAKEVVPRVGKRWPKSAKTSWRQKGLCNKHTKLQFRSILTRKILMLSNATINRSRPWLHVPSAIHWSISIETHQVVEILTETSTKMYTSF